MRRGARLSLNVIGKQMPMWCAPLSPARPREAGLKGAVFRHPPPKEGYEERQREHSYNYLP
jgi:hypothetical protein